MVSVEGEGEADLAVCGQASVVDVGLATRVGGRGGVGHDPSSTNVPPLYRHTQSTQMNCLIAC